MTDLTNQSEKVFKCPAKGCSVMVPASGREEHKRGHSDAAAFRNQVLQFLQRYGGDYLADQFSRLDKDVRGDGTDENPGLIPDVDDLLNRVEKLEKTAKGSDSSGVQVDTWDDPDLTNAEQDVPQLENPLVRINPLTGLPA
jgi:hypothetical protein